MKSMLQKLGSTRGSFTGRAPNEPDEFEKEYQKFSEILSRIRQVEQDVINWFQKIHTLKEAAMSLSETVDTRNRAEIKLLINQNSKDSTILDAIKSKIFLLDHIVTQRKVLAKLGNKCKQGEKKIADLQKKLTTYTENNNPKVEGVRENLDTTQAKLRVDTEKYESLRKELNEAILFITQHYDSKNGPLELLKHELDTFRSAQFQYLLNCQRLLQGSSDTQAVDLEHQFRIFQEDLSKKQSFNFSATGGSMSSIQFKNIQKLVEEHVPEIERASNPEDDINYKPSSLDILDDADLDKEIELLSQEGLS